MNAGRAGDLASPFILPSPSALEVTQETAQAWTDAWHGAWGVTVAPAPQLVPERDQDHPLGLYAPFVMTLLLLLPQVDPALPQAWRRLAAAGEHDIGRVKGLLHDAAAACGRSRYFPALERAVVVTCAQTAWWLTPGGRPKVERHVRLMFSNVLMAWTVFDVIPRELLVRATGLFIGVATTYGIEDERAPEASEALAQQLNALPEQVLREALPALQEREQEFVRVVDRLAYDCYSSGHQDGWEGSDLESRVAEAEPLLGLLHHAYVASVGREAQPDAQRVRETLATLLGGSQ